MLAEKNLKSQQVQSARIRKNKDELEEEKEDLKINFSRRQSSLETGKIGSYLSRAFYNSNEINKNGVSEEIKALKVEQNM